MKCIVLCGGYAKRLWPLTKNVPKPLLDINGKTMIDIILDKLESVKDIDNIIVSTNARFKRHFLAWLDKTHKNDGRISFISEPTTEENCKLGTIAGIQYVLEQKNIDDDCLIIAGDNLFDFSVQDFINYFKENKAPVIAVFDVKDFKKAQLYGVVTADKEKNIINFTEKPDNPESTLVATCCYLLPKNVLGLFKTYIDEGNRKDSPGYFIDWLRKRRNVKVFVFKGHWFDIGDLESLEKARDFMKSAK